MIFVWTLDGTTFFRDGFLRMAYWIHLIWTLSWLWTLLQRRCVFYNSENNAILLWKWVLTQLFLITKSWLQSQRYSISFALGNVYPWYLFCFLKIENQSNINNFMTIFINILDWIEKNWTKIWIKVYYKNSKLVLSRHQHKHRASKDKNQYEEICGFLYIQSYKNRDTYIPNIRVCMYLW